jgi:hypothetical protein
LLSITGVAGKKSALQIADFRQHREAQVAQWVKWHGVFSSAASLLVRFLWTGKENE